MSHYKGTLKYSFLFALLLAAITQAFATPVKPVNYQGFLTQPDGTPIDTTIGVIAELWTANTAGVLLYSESHPAVSVTKGRFSIEIGTGAPISGTFDADQFQQETWLALTIDSELLTPRSRLGTAAGSQHAEIAERLSTSCADGEWIGFRGGELACYECSAEETLSGCYEGDPATEGVGKCSTGFSACINGAFGGACNNQILPGAETCNGIDEDCNGLVDDGDSLPGCIDLYTDAGPEGDGDGDGFGDTASLSCLCNNPPGQGTTNVGGDCDNTDANVFPGQTLYFVTPSNGGTFDYNCNGTLETISNLPVASCTYNGATCDYVAGYNGSLPDCGMFGLFSTGCSQSGTACTITTGSLGGTQRCH